MKRGNYAGSPCPLFRVLLRTDVIQTLTTDRLAFPNMEEYFYFLKEVRAIEILLLFNI